MDFPFPIQRVAIVVVGLLHLLIRVPGFESTNNNFCACLLMSELDYLFNYKANAMFLINLIFLRNIF